MKNTMIYFKPQQVSINIACIKVTIIQEVLKLQKVQQTVSLHFMPNINPQSLANLIIIMPYLRETQKFLQMITFPF